MPRDVVKLTKTEFLERVATLSRPLTRHLDTWDAGLQDASEDVALLCRILLANGEGDHAIATLCKWFGLDFPTFHVSAPIDLEPGAQVHFILERLPFDWSGTSGSVELTLDEWLNSLVLRTPHRNARQVSWERLVREMGNTFGGHLSPDYPPALDQVKVFGAHGVPLRLFLLRCAAVVAENVLRELLPLVGVKESVRPSRRDLQLGSFPVAFAGLATWAAPDGTEKALPMMLPVQVEMDPTYWQEIVRYEFNGGLERMIAYGGSESGTVTLEHQVLAT